MSLFIRLSTQVLTDAKMLAAGSDACWLWTKGLLYSKVHLTDGFIPTDAIEMISVGIRSPKAAVKRLVALELWYEAAGGYTVGTERWSRWQNTREDVEKNREVWRDRQRRSREKRVTKSVTVTPGVTRDVTPPVTRDSRHQSTEYRVQSTEQESTPLPPKPVTRDNFAADPEENVPDGLAPTQYATFVFEQLGVPASNSLKIKLGDAIGILAREDDSTPSQATKHMLDRMREAQRDGPVKWGFWLEERQWTQQLQGVSTEGWEP